jgi:hypothetical protein
MGAGAAARTVALFKKIPTRTLANSHLVLPVIATTPL